MLWYHIIPNEFYVAYIQAIDIHIWSHIEFEFWINRRKNLVSLLIASM